MKKLIRITTVMIIALFLAVNGFAYDFGNDITIFDRNKDAASSNSWYNTEGEDQEVEPGMQRHQKWDLEGFFLNGTTLTMIGGYNFAQGVDGWTSGDIFLDINGDAEFGDTHGAEGIREVTDTFGYDYAIDLSFDGTNYTYDVYSLNGVTKTETAYYGANQGSNPWRYVSGGDEIAGWQDVSMDYYTGLTDTDTGFSGGTHYGLSVDLGFLNPTELSFFLAHYTMKCGNDNLIGEGGTVPTPEPATILLLGIGLIGLAGLGKRRNKK
jgi:hypothetical protein